jgi:hypothetical protein
VLFKIFTEKNFNLTLEKISYPNIHQNNLIQNFSKRDFPKIVRKFLSKGSKQNILNVFCLKILII